MASLVMIIPAARQDDCNALVEAMGWGPDNFACGLSKTGKAPATHYVCHLANASDTFLAMLAAAQEGQMPEGGEAFAAATKGMIVSLTPAPWDHVERALSEAGLKLITYQGDEA
jgi:ActR/RegA family two-component response regulator